MQELACYLWKRTSRRAWNSPPSAVTSIRSGGGILSSLNSSGLSASSSPCLSFFASWGPLIGLLLLATVFVFLWLFFNRKVLNLPWWGALIASFAHTLIGVASVYAFACLENLIGGGSGRLSLYGGIFFMPLFYLCFACIRKIPFSASFDIFLPCLIGTLLFARVNCLFSGCCLGVPIEGSSIRVPTREMELVGNFTFLMIALALDYQRKLTGRLYPLYMIGYGALRFTLEWFRESDSPFPLHLGHIWSLVSIGVGAVFFIVLSIHKRKEKES